jgi:hypothetical protein
MQWLISLEIDHRPEIQSRRNFGYPIRPARMITPRHLHPTQFPRNVLYPGIIRRDNHLHQTLCLPASLHHMLDQRLSPNQRQRLSWKPGRSKSCRDDADNFHPRVVPTSRQIARLKSARLTGY